MPKVTIAHRQIYIGIMLLATAFYAVLLCPPHFTFRGFLHLLILYKFYLWWSIRIIFVLLVLPLMVIHYRYQYYCAVDCIFFILAGFPLALVTAYLQEVSVSRFIFMEGLLYLLEIEIRCFFTKVDRQVWRHYYPITLLLITFPLVLYYLYWEVWQCDVPWLLWLTPLGVITTKTFIANLPYLCFILYPLTIFLYRN